MLLPDSGRDMRSAALALNGLGNKADENVDEASDGSTLLLGDATEGSKGEATAKKPRKRPPPLERYPIIIIRFLVVIVCVVTQVEITSGS